MRYIDQEELRLPTGWLERAKEATKEVTDGGDPNDGARVWRELKDRLADLFHDKCWFCESQIDRSDNAVDHFRPKNRVSDAARQHNGYRWLAFVPKNFRYSCTFCNSLRKDVENGTAGGKADRFPLLNEAKRLYAEADGALGQETPTLLDPCELDDWELLGCKKENGEPCAASEESISKRRVDISIEVYHLAYEATCKRRHSHILDMLSKVDLAKKLFPKAADPDVKEQFRVVAKQIKRMISRKAPFSGEMIFLLKGERHSEHPWIQKLIES